MHLTDRTYQSSLSDFMVRFKPVTFSIGGVCVNKVKLFDEIYRNHIDINSSEPFDVKKDVTCQLLWSGHHPVITSTRRIFVDFNEDIVLKEAVSTVINKHAIAVMRDKVRTDRMEMCDIIGLVTHAMEYVYSKHSDIDKEIEVLIK